MQVDREVEPVKTAVGYFVAAKAPVAFPTARWEVPEKRSAGSEGVACQHSATVAVSSPAQACLTFPSFAGTLLTTD